MAIHDHRMNTAAPTPRFVRFTIRPDAPDLPRADGRHGLRADRSGERFTAFEHGVLEGLAAGLSDLEIALRLMVFEPPVRAALRSICRKLSVPDRVGAAAQAARLEVV